jgi:hypothetical protein
MEFEFSKHFFGGIGEVTSESVPNQQAFSKQGMTNYFLQIFFGESVVHPNPSSPGQL